MICLVDIDGTIADISHRLGYIQCEDKNWDRFFDEMVNDLPISGTPTLIKALAHYYDIVYVTGRPDSHRKQTEWWLEYNGFPMLFSPYMRKAGDHRPDYQVKEELYNSILKDMDVTPQQVRLAIEDRKQMVDLWRSKGILTLQPKDGDY